MAFGRLGALGTGFSKEGGGGASPPVLWTPLNLGAALIAWWDAQYLPNLTFNVSNISAWADRKSGLSVSQATGANQPAWSATARNGKAGLTFNGSSTFLSGSSTTFPSGSNASTMAVAGFLAAATAGFAMVYGSGSTLNWRAIDSAVTSGNVVVGLFAGDISTSVTWLNTDRFVEYLVASGSQQVFVDGTSGGTSSATPNTTAGSTVFIGKQVATNFFNGVIQQVVVANSVLSTSQRQKLEGWESWYDGKNGSNLPVSSPYKNRPPYVSDP